MIFCQTLWTNKKNLLEDNFGWLMPQYHLMSWALSSMQLAKHYGELHLYTDSIGKTILIDQLELPYTNVFNDYDDLNCSSCLWALPKLMTYANQKRPFLHIDGDVIVWEPIDKAVLSGKLIAQNIEKGTEYYQNLFEPFLKELKFAPSILKRNLFLPNMRAYNTGIIGGYDVDFFKRYVDLALKMIRKKQNDKLNGNFNIIIEQLLFYSLAKKENKEVTCLTDKLIKDNGYLREAFVDFTNVQKLKYLHLIGQYKRDKEICDWLARYLRQENEEVFLKIVTLFKKQHYFYNRKLEEITSAIEPGKKSKFRYNRSEEFIKSINPKINFNFNTELIKYIEISKNLFLKELFKYEQKIKRLCIRFAKIDFCRLKELENVSMKSIHFLHMSREEKMAAVLIRHPFLEIIYTSIDWTNIQLKEAGNINIRCSDKKDIIISIIPEIFFSGYRELVLDEISANLIILTDIPISYKELLDKMKTLFPVPKNKKEIDAFYELISLKVENLIKNKLLFFNNNNN